jgi:Na+/melibiose symporter-like transporter
MLQRLIGVALGAIVTFVVLFLMKPGVDGGDPNQGYAIAVVLGAVVSFLWPWVIGFYLARRAKERRDDRIQKEVEKQLAEKS